MNNYKAIKYPRPAQSKDAALCMYCGGPRACRVCGMTCRDAGGLTDEGLCAGCSVKKHKATNQVKD